jgi:hypothetical protein
MRRVGGGALSQAAWHARPLSVKAVGAASLRCQLPYCRAFMRPAEWTFAMHTALVLDIDGALCPASGFSPFGDLVEVGVVLRPIRVVPALCAALADLATRPGVTPVWLTSWLPQARRAMRAVSWTQLGADRGERGARHVAQVAGAGRVAGTTLRPQSALIHNR